jgi:hypothetical protein
VAQTLDPWNVRASDFNRQGLHAPRTQAYWLLFQFLRMSPSYALAHFESSKGLTDGQKAQLPPDFDAVRSTYALLGDVWHSLFREWWLRRGIAAFGQVGERPKVRKVKVLPAGVHPPLDDALRDYQAQREDEGLAPALLLSIPTMMKASEALAEVKRLLEQHRTKEAAHEPKLKLAGQRQRHKELMEGIKLLRTRATLHDQPLWRIGAVRGINTNSSKFLDWRKKGEETTSPEEVERRKTVTNGTWRDLKKYETIAENAARGRFPCQDKVAKVEFDYPLLQRRMMQWGEWESKEMQRLLAAKKR